MLFTVQEVHIDKNFAQGLECVCIKNNNTNSDALLV